MNYLYFFSDNVDLHRCQVNLGIAILTGTHLNMEAGRTTFSSSNVLLCVHTSTCLVEGKT